MDPHIRASIQTNTFYYFIIILFITTASQLATMITIVFADISGKENLIAITIVGSAFIGAFGIIRMMTNMKLLQVIWMTKCQKQIMEKSFRIYHFISLDSFLLVFL